MINFLVGVFVCALIAVFFLFFGMCIGASIEKGRDKDDSDTEN